MWIMRDTFSRALRTVEKYALISWSRVVINKIDIELHYRIGLQTGTTVCKALGEIHRAKISLFCTFCKVTFGDTVKFVGLGFTRRDDSPYTP